MPFRSMGMPLLVVFKCLSLECLDAMVAAAQEQNNWNQKGGKWDGGLQPAYCCLGGVRCRAKGFFRIGCFAIAMVTKGNCPFSGGLLPPSCDRIITWTHNIFGVNHGLLEVVVDVCDEMMCVASVAFKNLFPTFCIGLEGDTLSLASWLYFSSNNSLCVFAPDRWSIFWRAGGLMNLMDLPGRVCYLFSNHFTLEQVGWCQTRNWERTNLTNTSCAKRVFRRFLPRKSADPALIQLMTQNAFWVV